MVIRRSSAGTSAVRRLIGAVLAGAVSAGLLTALGASPSSAAVRPARITVTCPGPQCPYTPPTTDEQGAAADVTTRINLERAAPQRDYTFQGTHTVLPALTAATGAEQTAQAAAEWQADNNTLADYGGPRPAGYTYGTGGNAAYAGSSSGVDDVVMHSYGHAGAVLSAAPTEVAVGAACSVGGALYVTELFFNTDEASYQAGQARYNAEIAQNNVYATSGGTITTVTDTTGTGPATNAFPQQPIVAGNNAPYVTGVDWTCSGTSHTSGAGPSSGLPAPVVGMAATPTGGGYWLADASGGVSAHGNAANYGSMAGQPLNQPIAHIVATPDGGGYWLVAADGGTFAFGDAGFFGSMGGRPLNAPVVDLAPTADGRGYWLVASDGGIFAFGDAQFHGSMGGQHLNKPVVGIAADYSTGGYWLVATDGGLFAFTAPFFGSTGAMSLNRPVNGMAGTSTGGGYWLVASDGGIFAYGNAQFHGSTGAMTLNAPVVGMAADPATGG
jgi:hypothetical protein